MKIQLPVTWEVCGMVEVEAGSINEAMDVFIEKRDEIPLPTDCEYVDGSFDLSMCEPECIQVYNPNAPIDKEEDT